MGAKLTCISTGSIGNCFILNCNGEKLILELGIKWRSVLRALDYKLEDVVACVCTHQHQDHIKSVPNALSYGLQVYSSSDVASIYPRVKIIYPMTRIPIGNYKVMALPVPHGDCDCFSYHITLPDGQTLLFATDAQTLPYKISNVNNLIVECNYANELIVDHLCGGKDVRSSFNSHMELSETIKVINRLKSPSMNNLILIHLSESNASDELFKKRIWQECGVRAKIAEKNSVFDLQKDEF